jgi:hypothetical protein
VFWIKVNRTCRWSGRSSEKRESGIIPRIFLKLFFNYNTHTEKWPHHKCTGCEFFSKDKHTFSTTPARWRRHWHFSLVIIPPPLMACQTNHTVTSLSRPEVSRFHCHFLQDMDNAIVISSLTNFSVFGGCFGWRFGTWLNLPCQRTCWRIQYFKFVGTPGESATFSYQMQSFPCNNSVKFITYIW